MKPFVAIDGVLDYLFFIIFRCISVENCAQTENLCCRLEAVLGPGTNFLSRTGSSRQQRSLCRSQSASKMYDFVAAGAPFFTFLTS